MTLLHIIRFSSAFIKLCNRGQSDPSERELPVVRAGRGHAVTFDVLSIPGLAVRTICGSKHCGLDQLNIPLSHLDIALNSLGEYMVHLSLMNNLHNVKCVGLLFPQKQWTFHPEFNLNNGGSN